MTLGRPTRGFTLIELALATALAVLLLGAALAVFSGIARDRARMALATADSSTVNSTQWTELLRRDLASATDWQATPSSLAIHSLHALDPASLDTVDRPCLIRYRIIRSQSSPTWLIREQQYLDNPGVSTSKNLVTVAIRQFALQPLGDDETAKLSMRRLPPTAGQDQPGLALPRRVALTLGFDDASQGVRLILCLR